MIDSFFKFPSTPHLALLEDVEVRDDKVLSEEERKQFLLHPLVVEEKVDGANLGISFNPRGEIRVQNRGGYLELPNGGQWKNLPMWLNRRTDDLFECLFDRYILFGEWCYAKHSIFYNRLPDWFLAFDVFDKSCDRFLSSSRRDEILMPFNIFRVPDLNRGRFDLHELKQLLARSRFGNEPAEGLYLRFDDGDYLAQRTKLIRPAFVQSIEEHWTRSGIKRNRLAIETNV